MKKTLVIGLLILSSVLTASAQKHKQIVHYNLIFAPDLSNRLNPKLYPRAVNDVDIVDSVLDKVWPDILKLKRIDGQQDVYRIDFINKGLIGLYKINTNALTIDFRKFGSRQSDRINYILSRDHVTRTFPEDRKNLIREYRKFNNRAAISNNGADIWTYFQSGIDGRIVLPDASIGKVTHKFRNIMILMTDGYIEAGIYNKGYDLSAAKVAGFRNAFLKSRMGSMEAFLNMNPKFKITPVTNPFLKDLEVIVLEMYDRSLSKTGAATTHPTDMEIMKVIWTDWFKNSGVKKFELKPTAGNPGEPVQYIMDFIKK